MTRTVDAAAKSATLALMCVVSFYVASDLLSAVFPYGDERVGGLWAVIATLFAYRFATEATAIAAVRRMAATVVSFALCELYFLLLGFSVAGLGLLLAAGTFVVLMAARPEDVIPTGVTTAVVAIFTAVEAHDAWKAPLLRLLDTAVGTAVALVATGATSAWAVWRRGQSAEKGTRTCPVRSTIP